MAANRRTTARRKKRGSNRSGARAGLFTFGVGLVTGFAAAAALFVSGWIPGRTNPVPQSTEPAQATEIEPAASDDEIAGAPERNRYDFFTVLPEMEVVVPEQELSENPAPGTPNATGSGRYVLQVASFRNAADAEQLKARLALLGNVAAVQVVTVNGETWHRVRIGPVEGARRADEIRRQLQDNGIETLILRDST